jgi:hypothetical protein
MPRTIQCVTGCLLRVSEDDMIDFLRIDACTLKRAL